MAKLGSVQLGLLYNVSDFDVDMALSLYRDDQGDRFILIGWSLV